MTISKPQTKFPSSNIQGQFHCIRFTTVKVAGQKQQPGFSFITALQINLINFVSLLIIYTHLATMKHDRRTLTCFSNLQL